MQHSKLFRIIRTFKKHELKRIDQFLSTPFFNSNKRILKLFQLIKKDFPALEKQKFEKERAFAYLHPEAPYNDKKMRVLMSKLTKLLEQYITIQELKEKDELVNQLLINYYSKKEAYRAFEQELINRKKQLEDQALRDTEYYKEMLWLNHEHFFHPYTKKTSAGITSVNEIMAALDNFYALSKLKYASELFTRTHLLSEKHHIHLFAEVMELGQSVLAEKNPLISLYTMVINLQKNGLDRSELQKCIDHFSTYSNLMTPFNQSEVLHTLINLVLGGINNGDADLVHDALQLYQISIKNDQILVKGKIVYTNFINITIIGSAAKAFSWTKDFIEKFSSLIDQNFQEYAINMAWAFWHYQKGVHDDDVEEFEEAIYFLSQITYSSIPINLRIRSLLLRIYYDFHLKKNGNEGVLLDHLKAFEKYVSRNQSISEARAQAYLNLIKLSRKLARLQIKTRRAPEKVSALENEIKTAARLVLKPWLLEKIRAL